jgi:hypothetical protein
MLLKSWIRSQKQSFKLADLARTLRVSNQLLADWIIKGYVPEKREDAVFEATGIPVEKLRIERKKQMAKNKKDGIKLAQKALRSL